MKLMDLFEFMPKSKFSASYGSDKGNYPFFTSSNTIDKYCDDFIYDGEFLIIGDGGTGNCKHYNGKFSVSDHNYVLKPKSQTNALAVEYFLKKDNYQILNDGFKGIGIKNVSKSYIQNIDYKYNQNFSQNEIVKNIILIEKNIEREMQSINSLDCLIKSRFNEVFSRFPKIKLSNIANITMGQSPESKFYNDKGIGMPFFQGKADYGDKYTVVKHYSKKGNKVAKKGSILMSVRAPVGPVNIANCDCYIGRGLCSIEAKKEFSNNEFIYNALNNMQDEIVNNGKDGSTFKSINKEQVYELLLPKAPFKLQDNFSKFVEQVDKLKFNCQQLIKLYQELLDKKMDEYFS